MSITVTSAPAVEPISTAEAKEWLRIDSTDTSQDNILAILIKAVRERVESYTRRALITQTLSVELDSDDFQDPVFLPRPPVQSITSLTTYDEDANGDETSTVVDSRDYQLTDRGILKSRNDGWDINRQYRAGTVVYVAGYGNASTDVPADLILVMLELLALYFERRGDEDNSKAANAIDRELEILAKADPYKVYGY